MFRLSISYSTGTSLIGGPSDPIHRIAANVGALYHFTDELFYINCSARPFDVIFTINNVDYNVTSTNYIVPVSNSCASLIATNFSVDFSPAIPLIHASLLFSNFKAVVSVRVGFLGKFE